MEMPGRTGMMDRYRFGFNGKENDREWGTAGLTQDYGMRLYNPAVGRFLSVDPLMHSYPWNSTYAFAEGSPIEFIDLDGLEKFHYQMEDDGHGGMMPVFTHMEDYVYWSGPLWNRKKHINDKEIYIVHHTDKKFLHGDIEYYDEAIEYDTYAEAMAGDEDDFKGTWEDFGMHLLQGLENMAEEHGGGRTRSSKRSNTTKKTITPKKTNPNNNDKKSRYKSEAPIINGKPGGKKSVNTLLSEAKKMSGSDSAEGRYDKVGDYNDAVADFHALDGIDKIRQINSQYGKMYIGELPNGVIVNVRPSSKKLGTPTLEFNNKTIGEKPVKIRYFE